MQPYYQDSAVTIYHGDCREIIHTLGTFDLLLTDPPYGINFKYASYEDTQDNLDSLIREAISPAIKLGERSMIFSGISSLFKYPKPDWVFNWYWPTTFKYGKCGINQWQPILFYGNDISGFGSINGVIKSDVINIRDNNLIGISNGHPCAKPIKVVQKCILRMSNPGDLILDIFGGSGTTARAAKEMGRNATIIELEEKYCEIAARSMAQEVFAF